jgi:hypothetical protein
MYKYVCPHAVLGLLGRRPIYSMRPHTTEYVSYTPIRVLILLNVCPHTTEYVCADAVLGLLGLRAARACARPLLPSPHPLLWRKQKSHGEGNTRGAALRRCFFICRRPQAATTEDRRQEKKLK